MAIVKRVGESILDEGGFVSKIESLGSRDLPYRMRAHGQVHSKGRLVLVALGFWEVKTYLLKQLQWHDFNKK